MNAEKITRICDAVDHVSSFGDKGRQALVRQRQQTEGRINELKMLLAVPPQKHADIIRQFDLEKEVERINHMLDNWRTLKAAALAGLEAVVGLGVRKTVNPQVHELVQHLAKVARIQADGTSRPLTLGEIGLACGLSEGTVSKLRSGTYPTSVFPATAKRGRRAAQR